MSRCCPRSVHRQKPNSSTPNATVSTPIAYPLGLQIERVKSDMEIVMQSHKRDVDMKDAHLQQLDVDTEEAEEQTRFATTAYLARIRKIVRIQEERIAQLDAEFQHAKEDIE